ncbi:alpha-amidating enzyme precursor 1 [Biomphalaria glabrata]|nr:alpha-amidating enzyme precursor 1 [Biomphalaria glabrata]
MMHVQEYYDEYAANDMREKGIYGTATSSEEGLSRNRNKGFEAISQQLEHFPRKNAAASINPSIWIRIKGNSLCQRTQIMPQSTDKTVSSENSLTQLEL